MTVPRHDRALTDLPISIGGSDVSVTVGDPSVTVGELATALGVGASSGRPSVVVNGREIPAFTRLVAASLRPGEVIDGPAEAARGTDGSLVVAVTAGVDAGRHVPLAPGGEVVIGRGLGCALRLHSNGVSTRHSVLRLTLDGQLLVADAGSRNGTVVAGHGVGSDFEPLAAGEAIRCGPAVLTVRPIPPVDTPRATARALTQTSSGSVPYYRSPIDQLDPATTEIALPIGPRRARAARLGLLSLLLPVGMGVGMVAVTGNFLYALFVLMSPALMLLTFLDRKIRGRRSGKVSRRRYKAELVDFREELAEAAAAELLRRRLVYPDAVELIRRADEAGARLWERRHDHGEFMVLTAATADVTWSPPVPALTADLPAVEDALEEASVLLMAPLTIPVRGGALVGLAGTHENSRAATLAGVRSLIIQAAVLHGPAELRLLVICTPATATDWEWVKWLPHLQPTFAGGRLLVASDDPDTLAVDELLADAGTSAALLAVVDTEGSADNGDAAVRRLFRSGSTAISGLVIGAGIDALPDRCDIVIEHHDVAGEITCRWPREGGRSVDGIGSGLSLSLAEHVARSLSRLHDPEAPSGTAALPALVGLADVIGLTGATAAEVTDGWDALNVPLAPVAIGLGQDGPVLVDLDRSGPHLAVIGGRGAGKTEALASIVVSLAAANPPDRLHLLLWGESFAHLRRLPHTAGFLGRIDDDSLRKFTDSLDRELTRREQARTVANAAADGPAPAEARLVVIIDDVDTLLRTQPRSGDDLIRLFRRARGSGVHIIWSTSRATGGLLSDFIDLAPLRLVLRLTSNQDSIEVMGLDAAARLERSLPGRGFMVAGRGEPRHLQTASVSSPTPRPQGRFAVRPFDLSSARDMVAAPDGAPDERVIVGLVSAAGTPYQRPGDLFSTAASAVGVLRSPGLPELLGIADIDTFDPLESWRYGVGDQLLRVPIGVDAQLRPVVIDLKESALAGMGPHGLLVGATGSGKSELLRTLVTGLAVTHTPELLSLVLVDFKGGANFAAMANLPHVSGMVTNLADDLALVDRVLAALEGELRRRQALLAAAGNLASARDYRSRWENGTLTGDGPGVGEPLPELLVIVDEFAELLDSQPDFLTFFLTIGRVGRSLGIHLLLASQRLEEGKLKGLDTYLSYRIGLRTFSAIESRTVLGVPDAYTLPTAPGGGYLKVGTDSFDRFQASYVSGPHTPAGGVSSAPEGEGPSVMSTMVERLLQAPVDPVHQIWLPPLPAALTLDSLFEGAFVHDPERGFTAGTWGGTGRLVVPVGLVDEPDLQRQTPLVIDFSGPQGNLVLVGAPQTGKSTFVRSAVLGLAVTHTPLEAQVYVIDMGGGTLDPLSGLPQVGAVAGRLESEKVRRLVSHVEGMLNARERLFRDRAIDGMGEFRRLRDNGELASGTAADVILVIDGWAGFKSAHEQFEPVIADLATRGLGYGVHVLLTANRWSEIRANVLDSFGGRLELRLNAPADSVIDRRKSATIHDGQNGRGLHPAKRFFQVALPRLDAVASDEMLQAALKVAVEHVATRWEGPVAPAVKLLPTRVVPDDIPPVAEGVFGTVVGLLEDDLAAWSLDLDGAEPHFIVYGDGETGKTTFLRTLLRGLADAPRESVELICVDYRRGLLEALPEGRLLGYAGSEPAVKRLVEELLAVLSSRQPGAEVTAAQLRDRSWWTGPEYYVVVDDYDLVVTPSGSPLAPLVPLLAQGRELGFHLVLARRVAGAARTGFEPVIARIKEISPAGFVMAGDRNEGALLGGVRAGDHIAGRGVLVSRRHLPVIAQVLVSE